LTGGPLGPGPVPPAATAVDVEPALFWLQPPLARCVIAAVIAFVKSPKYWASYVSVLFSTDSSWGIENSHAGIVAWFS
jgi:hypothetical protein